jgi:branched-chain amino acid transport system ATP-binding protein
MGGTENQVILTLEDVGVRFNGHPVLQGINLALEAQSIVSIIGPNGAGKTTLFNVICGHIRAAVGKVVFKGEDITRRGPHRICRAGIARTFQIPRPFPDMTVRENVQMGAWFGKEDGEANGPAPSTGAELLDMVGLSHKGNTRAKELTLSEQRRLEVARALATRPRLLLLDEFAAGLSPNAIRLAVELIENLRRQGLTLLIIDHFLNLTARVSDRLVALDCGKIIVEGDPSVVLKCPEVMSSYLGERLSEPDMAQPGGE